MPFESKAQWRKFGALKGRGEISEETFHEWAHKSRPYSSLPSRKGKKPPLPKSRKKS